MREKDRANVCTRGTVDVRQQGSRKRFKDRGETEIGMQRRWKKKDKAFLKGSGNTRLCDHLSCSRCASCSGWGTAGVQRALLLWRNLTRPRKSSAAYSTQHSSLIASLVFPDTKSQPSATPGERPRQQATLSLPLSPPLRNYSH